MAQRSFEPPVFLIAPTSEMKSHGLGIAYFKENAVWVTSVTDGVRRLLIFTTADNAEGFARENGMSDVTILRADDEELIHALEGVKPDIEWVSMDGISDPIPVTALLEWLQRRRNPE